MFVAAFMVFPLGADSLNPPGPSAVGEDQGPNQGPGKPHVAMKVAVSSRPPPLQRDVQSEPGPLHNGYHFAGARTPRADGATAEWVEGVNSQITVTNPEVPHDGSVNWFFYAWVMAHRYTPTQLWIQVGWSEVSWRGNTQYVTVQTQDGVWRFFDSYVLTPGQVINVAVRWLGGTTWRSEIYWNNQWQTLYDVDLGIADMPYASQQNEAYKQDANTFHFGVPNTNFYNTHVAQDGSWSKWTTSYETGEYSDFPYCTVGHWTAKYWDWYMHKHTSGSTC